MKDGHFIHRWQKYIESICLGKKGCTDYHISKITFPHLEYSAYLRKQYCSNPYVSFTNDYEYIYNHKSDIAICLAYNLVFENYPISVVMAWLQLQKGRLKRNMRPLAECRPRQQLWRQWLLTPALTQTSQSTLDPRYMTCKCRFILKCVLTNAINNWNNVRMMFTIHKI